MFPPNTRILVVDDMLSMVEFLRKSLMGMGFTQILTANNGMLAYDVISKQHAAKQPVELVLADWAMPVCNGFELLKRIRASQEFSTLPFIMVTAEGETNQVLEVVNAGVSNYLVKPITAQSLKDKIEKVWKKLNDDSSGT